MQDPRWDRSLLLGVYGGMVLLHGHPQFVFYLGWRRRRSPCSRSFDSVAGTGPFERPWDCWPRRDRVAPRCLAASCFPPWRSGNDRCGDPRRRRRSIPKSLRTTPFCRGMAAPSSSPWSRGTATSREINGRGRGTRRPCTSACSP
jgi:hypothetical protein